MRRRIGLALYRLALRLHPELREMQEAAAVLMARQLGAAVASSQRAQHQANVARIARDN